MQDSKIWISQYSRVWVFLIHFIVSWHSKGVGFCLELGCLIPQDRIVNLAYTCSASLLSQILNCSGSSSHHIPQQALQWTCIRPGAAHTYCRAHTWRSPRALNKLLLPQFLQPSEFCCSQEGEHLGAVLVVLSKPFLAIFSTECARTFVRTRSEQHKKF